MEQAEPAIDQLWGVGVIGLVVGLLVYLAVLALMLWIGYLIVKAAVRNGLKEHTTWLEGRRGPLR
ncbi:hypothetical protein [Agromyces subbeticus]|uniref:hypothetical protein n=1 Tax=Agromyces subbeticus TaxID=293890 RepID=UPI0003B67EF8|nr:hypothetical protein [Agromyces subbeticus]